jgi:hypothetical protein
MNDRRRKVLTGVLRDRRRLAGMPWDGPAGVARGELGRRRLCVRRARDGLVPMNLAGWIGHAPSDSERVLFHREHLRLEGMGLIERHNLHGGRRTTHLRLTPAGRRLAEELLAEDTAELDADVEDDGERLDLEEWDFSDVDWPSDAAATKDGGDSAGTSTRKESQQ